jgi:3-deoxy-D-manno-octulosonic-acid transferase
MTKTAFIPNFMAFYNILWTAALPFLKKHPRLADTFFFRTGAAHLEPADIWIQAASAGEAFMAACVLQHLSPDRPVRVLVTTTTAQGMEILSAELKKKPPHPLVSICRSWFPFDRPAVAAAAVKAVNPKVMVLLETELWPALLHFLRQNRTRILVVNGRMSQKSSRAYQWTRPLWSRVSPHRILAVSGPDAARFARVFDTARITVMPNIKFETMPPPAPATALSRPGGILPCPLPVSILASIRRQEESLALQMIQHILARVPDQVVAVFPRHMHRLGPWKHRLKKSGVPYSLRSQLSAPPSTPGIILWDRFGEMHQAFRHARTVFVGGSLVPLGGQNFLEPLCQGAPVVTGPFWDDFFWVGKQVFDTGLIQKTPDWRTAADAMVFHLTHPQDPKKRQQKAQAYVAARAGGAAMACQAILSLCQGLDQILDPPRPGNLKKCLP